MASPKRQYSTTVDDELGEQIEKAADARDISVAKLLREGARRAIEQSKVEDND